MDTQDMDLMQYWTHRRTCGIHLHDAVHGKMLLGPLARRFLQTTPVQALRWKHQLGCSQYVFPTAEHSRFGHSVGTSHLAVEMMRHLSETGARVRPYHIDLMEVAGLCHDLGHGPLSHVFEQLFLPAVGVHDWHHEEMSTKLLEYIVDKYSIELPGEGLQFVQDVINNGSKASKQRDWSGQQWLLQVVANDLNAVDVDKIDYLLRDSYMAGVTPLRDYKTLLSSCKVIDDEICYDVHHQTELAGLFNARAAMHRMVYQHIRSKATELMMVDAMKAADPVLHISQNIFDPATFVLLTDTVIGQIQRDAALDPQNPHLRQAAAILERVDTGRLYQWVAEATIPAEFVRDNSDAECCLPEGDILAQQDHNFGVQLRPGDVRVHNMKIDHCKGRSDPLDFVKLYDSSGNTWPASMGLTNRPASFLDRKVRVFLAKDCPKDEISKYVNATRVAFDKAVQQRFGSNVHIRYSSSVAQQEQQQMLHTVPSSGSTLLPLSAISATAAATVVSTAAQPLLQVDASVAASGVVAQWSPQAAVRQQERLLEQQFVRGVKRRLDGVEYVPASDDEDVDMTQY